ncbi:hypothetical protein P1J78_15980 [Psychromarinibacter sp. C21-152]|uniref:Antifreeze glycopeptide polyprotein n=1 Tax=Psychromarinibacter sediminicola TaxID=3033385 RepID=A0AAE3NTN9_9RHOB|nr:hypothetical protein [Psychromarinibacter sediminicola]MDF0602239.1 hypothetical protein [Psychromarinibacter sediminicola]
MAAERYLVRAFALGLALTGPAAAQDRPMSAIDWLSRSVEEAPDTVAPDEPATSGGAGVEEITVTPLGEVSNDAVGLLPAAISRLPRDLWGTTPSRELAELFEAAQNGLLPATQDLLLRLLLAELDPPADSDPGHALFLARIDALMAMGAVEQAQALLERAGPDDPASFARWFDASLLTGTEDAACAALGEAPELAPSLAARIFCLARNGDWNAAALTLETSRALGELTGAEDAILARYLDPETFAGAPELAPPMRPTPLVFRLYEAVGEPIPTHLLPLPFAQADLQLNTGWKAQIEAAERLARSGVIDSNRLLGLYTERQPAASGGVWDRVAAVQRLDAALAGGDSTALADALVLAWEVLGHAGLRAVLADMFAARLADRAPAGEAGRIAFEIGLLSDRYAAAAEAREPKRPMERFLKAVARGDVSGVTPPDQTAAAIADGFRATAAPDRLQEMIDGRRLGEAILRGIALAADGAAGDPEKLSAAIALFRAAGLDEVARRFALQALILVEDA